MPFDDLQESDETTTPAYRARPGYLDFERSVAGRDLPIDSTSDLLSPDQQLRTINAQFQRQLGAARQPANPPSIGQRILALGQRPPADPSGPTATTNGIGHRIVAGTKQPVSFLQIPRLNLRGGASPMNLDSDQTSGEGIFSTFIPYGSDGVAMSPRSRNSSAYASSDRSSGPDSLIPEVDPVNPSSAQNKKGSVSGSSTRRSATTKQVEASGQGAAKQQAPSQKQDQKQSPNGTQQLPGLQPPQFLQTEQPAKPSVFNQQPEPTWTEIREYIAQEARAYGIPVKLAEAVVRHETNFDTHSRVVVPGDGIDWGIMAVNSSNQDPLSGPDGWRFQIDTERVKNDWKYNVHVGMAILKKAYGAAAFDNVGEENIARETYARYNAPRHWRQLYTVPKGHVAQHVDQFMKSWHRYYDDK